MRNTLMFAGLWHFLWVALLIPYAVVVAMILGGQQSAQDLVDGLARAFALAVGCAGAGLVLNVGLGLALTPLVAAVEPVVGRLVAALIFAVIWFFAIQDLLPYLGYGTGASINPAAFWAAFAGAAYGLVLALGLEGPLAETANAEP